MTANPFQQPYLASNDNRTIAGIDCPVCKSARSSIQFKSVPAQQAVKINVEPDLTFRPVDTETLPYNNPDKLPEELRGNPPVIYWRCESCSLIFHQAFDALSDEALIRQLYNTQFTKTLPQLKTELPLLLSRLIYRLFQKDIKNLRILSCESELVPVSKTLATMGVEIETYAPLSKDLKNHKPGSYDLICTYALLERTPEPEEVLRKLLSLCSQDAVIFLSHYAFNFRDPEHQIILSPRSGLIWLHSHKSLELIFQSLKLKHLRISPTITLLYRQNVPAFAEHLKGLNLDMTEFLRQDEEEKEEAERAEEVTLQSAPTPVEVHTSRLSIRESRYGKVAYNHHDRLVGTALDNYGEYLIGDQELLAQMIQPHWIVFEAAANIGLHCMMMAPMLNGGGHIHAFEPYRESYHLLGANLLLNNLDNVSTYRYALGAFPGMTRLLPVDSDAPGSMASKGWAAHYEGAEVPLHSLDGLEPEQCHFFHVCAPECEPTILQGGQKTLNRFQPALLVNCVNEADFQAIFRMLDDLGYRMYWHIQPFYAEENFFNNPDNAFGSAGAAKILALHSSRNQNVGLSEIQNENDWIV